MTAAIKPDDWPPDLLKIHFDALREADSKAVSAALAAAGLAVDKALAAAALAVDKAEGTAEKWRENANEWRTAMDDRERNFMSNSTANARFSAIDSALADLAKSRDQAAGRQAAYGVAMFVVFSLITLALRFL